MPSNQAPMSKFVAAAILVTILPLLIFAMTASQLGQLFSPVLGLLPAKKIVDRQAVPRGSYVEVRGLPKDAITINEPGGSEGQMKVEALTAFVEEPRLILYSPENDEQLTNKVIPAEKGGEFYQQQVTVSGRLDIPPKRPVDELYLKEFVSKHLNLPLDDNIRILYVGAKPEDARLSALAGASCGTFFVIAALVAWTGVLLTYLRRRRREE